MGQLLLFFLCNFSSLFSYVGDFLDLPRFPLFSQLLIGRYILAIQQIITITHEEHLRLLLFFLCNFSNFFSYVGGILVNNLFSLLLIDVYILAIPQIIRHEEHCDTLFDMLRSTELPQKPRHHGHNKRRWLKQPQSHFH